MNILLLNQYFGTSGSTFSARAYEFSRILVQKGHKVTVICGESANSDLRPSHKRMITSWDIEGIRVCQINIPYNQKMSYTRRIFSFLKFAFFSSIETIRCRNIDIYYASSTPLTIAIPGIIGSVAHGKPFVFEVRDLWPEIPICLGILRSKLLIFLARKLELLAYRHATHIIASSPGISEGIVARGISPEKITVISNVADNDLFAAASTPVDFASDDQLKKRKLLVYAGAIGYANDLSYLVEIAKYVYEVNIEIGFLVIGPGAERNLIMAKAQQAGVLGKNFWIHPPVKRKNIPSVLSAATAVASFVRNHPVLWSISPAKLFDSFAAGKPAVINCGGWQAKLLTETGAGLVLPPDDPEKAATLLNEFMCSDGLLNQAGQRSKELALHHFDKKMLASKLEEVLLSALLGKQITAQNKTSADL